ncbi:winged helix-turn-helix domain-containing protein [Shewanella eurypsychrophilus]|uniref:Winged helix-turn-helix domain-containing protein n=1 Tax=Shewanella eurypsychrophilus TaxID=2593656 RepID=A0ABX6V4Q8_9GAMM|nr:MULTISPECIES: winged helix-turn-helix domain-containing protein [Shewanella]QFU21664.1 transcriptional regulator [Shewanella sp. YLB-09]QPG56954.1 winged helix-turn-helix domain-containing protein [Shewanella eurypsychrophilus]
MIEIKKEAVFTLAGCVVTPSDNSLDFKNCSANTEVSQDLPNEKISLQPKFIELLSYLARQYPNVVTREELIDNIWEGNIYVGTKALTNAIWHLRKHLTPLAEPKAQAIETVRKAGYRLLIEPEFSKADLVSRPEVLEVEQAKVKELSDKLHRGLLSFALFLIVVVAGLLFHLYQDSKHLIQTEQTRLTIASGAELYPAVSPDGRWLVYGKRSNLYLKDLHTLTDTPKRLTSNQTREIRAIWTLDGKSLLYPSEDRSSGVCHLSQLMLDSQQVVRLAPCLSDASALDISPDGSSIIYIWKDPLAQQSGLYELHLSGDTQPVRLSCDNECDYRDRDIAFSPDGDWIAISRRFGNISEDIFIRNRASGEEFRITQGLEDIRGLSWHPDSHKLVFSTENSGVRAGYLVDINSKKITDLSVVGFSYPKFVPHTNELVFSKYIKDFKVAYLELDQAIPTTIFPLSNSEFSYRNPDYSSVTKRIVYVSNETGHNEIWSTDIEGRNRKQHTDLKRRVAYPSWSHDGTKLAFLAPDDKNEGNKIHILELATGGISILASGYLDHRRPSWDFDDKHVLSSTHDGLLAFSLTNNSPKVVTPVEVRLAKVLNNSQMIFTKIYESGLWLMDLNQPEKMKILISSDVFDEDYNWALSDKGVYFRELHSGYQLINFWSFNTDLTTPILKLPSRSLTSYGAMSYIPSKRRLLMTLSEYSKRDVIMLKHKLLQ